MKDAQDNWPEDEASLTADSYERCKADENAQWAQCQLHRNIAHMHKVFSFENDTNELCQRYNVALFKRGIDVSTLLFAVPDNWPPQL